MYTSNRKTIYLLMKKGDVGMAKHFSKMYGTKDELSITLYHLQSEINFCSVGMPVNA